MSTALMEVPVVTDEHVDLVRRTIAQGASDPELKLFLYDCARQGVHPLDRLLHFTKRGGKYTPVTSIDLMRTRAADTGEYAGSDDAVFVSNDGGQLECASVTVWRIVHNMRCPFTATARWGEYCPGAGQDMMWRKMPHTMLAKCAESLALRKGFPRQLAGTYSKEEMEQAGPVDAIDVPPVETAPKPARAPRAPKPDAPPVRPPTPFTSIDDGPRPARPPSPPPSAPVEPEPTATLPVDGLTVLAIRDRELPLPDGRAFYQVVLSDKRVVCTFDKATRDFAQAAFDNGRPVEVRVTQQRPPSGAFMIDEFKVL